jgi:hypothetical protein
MKFTVFWDVALCGLVEVTDAVVVSLIREMVLAASNSENVGELPDYTGQ